MNRQEKIAFILKAISEGISANKIEPSRKGATITKLKKDSNAEVGEDKLNEMYKNAQALIAGKRTKTQFAPVPTIATIKEETNRDIAELLKRVQVLEEKANTLERENAKLREVMLSVLGRQNELNKENQELREKLADLDNQLSKIDSGNLNTTKASENIKGFYLTKRKTGGTDAYWYAGRKIDGKMYWVYLGKDTFDAETKIQNWLTKHPDLVNKI